MVFRRRQNQRQQEQQQKGNNNEDYSTMTTKRRSTKFKKRGGGIVAILLVTTFLILVASGPWNNNTLVWFMWTLNKEQHPKMIQSFRPHPTVVQYDFETNHVATLHGPFPKIEDKKKSTGHVISQTTDDSEDNEENVCQPMHEWQTSSFILCNPLHEFDMISEAIDGTLAFINCGGSRCAFKLKDVQGTLLALKIPKFHRDFAKYKYEASRIDGMAMERLTKSPYVLSTYGYCGLSQVIEYGEGGSVHDLIKRARLKGKDDMSPIDRLKVAIQLVTAVADLHTFEEDEKASITHNDLCCHQYILVDGVYKLNDFHLSHFLKRNKETNEVCQHPMALGRSWGLIHAPEEIAEDKVDNEKADDYVVGNVMYYVLTKEWIFEHERGSKGVKLLLEGKRSPFPEHIRNSSDPADKALMKAIMMCWTHDVSKRPSSRQISDFLIEQLEKITGEKVGGAVRVSIPPLPPNWDYSDSDFNNNFN